jgi:hypothetical protein
MANIGQVLVFVLVLVLCFGFGVGANSGQLLVLIWQPAATADEGRQVGIFRRSFLCLPACQSTLLLLLPHATPLSPQTNLSCRCRSCVKTGMLNRLREMWPRQPDATCCEADITPN